MRTLDVVFFKDGEQWMGVCTSVLIFAQGGSLDEARAVFAKTLLDESFLCDHFGHPIEDIVKAEPRYAEMFMSAKKNLGTREVQQFTLHERAAA